MVSPNPTNADFEVRLASRENITNYRLRVMNTLGQLILDQPFSSYAPVHVDLSGQADGYYLVQVADQKGSRTERVLLSRRQ